MAEVAPRPVATGTGSGGTGRLSSLPTPVKIGGVVGLAAVAFILWKRHKANAAGANSSVAGGPDPNAFSTQDYGFAPGGLAPPLMGYNPTGQIIGYDNNGQPIYGVSPPSSSTPGTSTNPGATGSGSGGTTQTPASPPTPSAIPTPVSPNGTPAPTVGSSGQPLPGNPNYLPANAIALPQPTQNSFAGTMGAASQLAVGQTGYLPNGLRVTRDANGTLTFF